MDATVAMAVIVVITLLAAVVVWRAQSPPAQGFRGSLPGLYNQEMFPFRVSFDPAMYSAIPGRA